MSVIAEISLPADGFELGQILTVEAPTSITLETVVPMGERPVPFFRIQDDIRTDFERAIRAHPAVNDLQEVERHADEVLYALDWDASDDSFVAAIRQTEGTFLSATGTAQRWTVAVRFPSHERLSAFHERCSDADIPLELLRVYNPTNPEAGPWFGLTVPQREALILAVQEGYYSIPRHTSSQDLAAELDISDQALTERLRRAIIALTTNTLLVTEEP